MLPLIRFISSMINREPQKNDAIENVDSACGQTLITEKDSEEDLLLKILEEADDLDNDDDVIDYCANVDSGGSGPQCFQAKGTITAVGVLDGVIDDTYQFQLKDTPHQIRVGQRVEYLAFQSSADDDIIVRKIIRVSEDQWSESENEDGEKDVEKNPEESKKKKEIFVRHKVCYLSRRVGREVFIDPPGDYSFHLDNVKISFVPLPGDWMTVVMRVEESEDSLNGCGEILEILEVMPLRCKSIEGVISHWKTNEKIGIINRETYFTLDACEIGYMPVVGDEINAHVIESQQGGLSWRALKVIPAIERTNYIRDNRHNLSNLATLQSQNAEELLKNKYGISISTKCSFGKLQFGKEKDMIVELKNSSRMPHHLTSFGFCNRFQSQMKLMEPNLNNRKYIIINCNETLKFVFRCQAKFFGSAEELFVWNFKAFNIGRHITVEVDDDYVKEVKNQRYEKKSRKEIDRENLVPTKNGFIINGVRSSRKASFIPVKFGMFRVPDQFWDIMADKNCRSEEMRLRLVSSIPCLNEELTVGNYVVRWHSLLYVEEVDHVLQMQQYNMSRVLFRRCGEYLVLDVPGVMEKRPSLIVGDAVYATDPHLTGPDLMGIKYEGFIHKIVRNDLFIKFNPTFHNSYDDKDYNVSFVSNRMGFRKCHQAINVAFKNLTSNWLFPSSLRPSPPLFILEDGEDEKNEEGNVMNGEEEQKITQQPTIDNNCQKEVNVNSEEKPPNSPEVANGVDILKKLSKAEIVNNEEKPSNPPALANGVDDIFKKLSKVITNNDLEKYQLQPAISNTQQKHLSPNLKDSIFNMPLKNVTNNNQNHNTAGANVNEVFNSNQSGLSSPPRLPVADWLLRSTQNQKRKNLIEYLNPDQQNNSEMTVRQNDEQTLPFNGQIKTLEEIEKQMLMSSSSKNMITLSEIEKPLLDKSNSNSNNSNKIKIKENSEKIDWNEDGYVAKTVVTSYVKNIEVEVKKSVHWFNKRLNHHQKEAVRRILRNEARPLPHIIFGPPGTGKTVTLVETALQILFLRPESRLLIGAPSNSAADCVTEKLIDTGIFPVGTLVRLCSLTYFTNEKCSDKLAPYCTTPEYRLISGEQTFIAEDGLKKSTREALGRHRVTVGTCVTLGAMYNMGFPQGHFTHVLVDEAGQATEPEILIPLCFLDNKTGQSVLVGDPQQLGPVTFSMSAKELGLGQSLIARLLDTFPYCRDAQSFPETRGFDPRLVTQLVDNYRSLPEILKLPSQMFYDDALVPHVTEDGFEASVLRRLKCELPPRMASLPPALIFHGVKGVNYQEEDSPSWFNPQEVVQAVAYVNKLYQYGLTCDDIGIITPYNKQAFKIRQLLTRLEVNLPKVGSVEEFQGQERLVILLSTVRTSRRFDCNMKQLMGFISSPQRLNVALTRARALLVVMGNPHLLIHDPYWRTVLDYCIKNNAYCGCDAPGKNQNVDETVTDINDHFAITLN